MKLRKHSGTFLTADEDKTVFEPNYSIPIFICHPLGLRRPIMSCRHSGTWRCPIGARPYRRGRVELEDGLRGQMGPWGCIMHGGEPRSGGTSWGSGRRGTDWPGQTHHTRAPSLAPPTSPLGPCAACALPRPWARLQQYWKSVLCVEILIYTQDVLLKGCNRLRYSVDGRWNQGGHYLSICRHVSGIDCLLAGWALVQ